MKKNYARTSAKQCESGCALAVYHQRPGARCGNGEVSGAPTKKEGDDVNALRVGVTEYTMASVDACARLPTSARGAQY